jgi:hypothetical protein
MSLIQANFNTIRPQVLTLASTIALGKVGSSCKFEGISSKHLKAQTEKVSALLQESVTSLTSHELTPTFQLLQKEWLQLLPSLQDGATLSNEMKELANQLSTTLIKLSDSFIALSHATHHKKEVQKAEQKSNREAPSLPSTELLPFSNLPATSSLDEASKVTDTEDEALRLQSDGLLSIVVKSYPNAILCAKSLLYRLTSGYYGKDLQTQASQLSPTLFSQNAFLKAMLADLISFKIPLKICEFFSEITAKEEKRLKTALMHGLQNALSNPTCETEFTAETIDKLQIPTDLYCAFLTILQPEISQNDHSIINKVRSCNFQVKEGQARAIQHIVTIQDPIERYFCLADLAKNVYCFDKLKALDLAFQISDSTLLSVTLNFLLNLEYLTRGKEALLKLVGRIQNMQHKFEASKKLISILLKTYSKENLLSCLTFARSHTRLHERAYCLHEIVLAIHNMNPIKAFKIGFFDMPELYRKDWLKNILAHFTTYHKPQELLEILQNISPEDHKRQAYLTLFGLFEKSIGAKKFDEWLKNFSSSDCADFLYYLMKSLSSKDEIYIVALYNHLMSFTLDFDNSKWYHKILKLLQEMCYKGQPELALKAAAKLFNKHDFIYYCVWEIAYKVFSRDEIDYNLMRLNLEAAIVSLEERLSKLSDLGPNDPEKVISMALYYLKDFKADIISSLQITKYIPIKRIQEIAEYQILNQAIRLGVRVHDCLLRLTDREMADYIAEKFAHRELNFFYDNTSPLLNTSYEELSSYQDK